MKKKNKKNLYGGTNNPIKFSIVHLLKLYNIIDKNLTLNEYLKKI